jgi:hypothetical protein
VFLTYEVVGIDFPLSLCCVPQAQTGCVFVFTEFQELDFLSYFFSDPLIVEQYIVQPPIVCVFSSAAFIVEF